MSDSLKDIMRTLDKREPQEIRIIKDYVMQHYNATPKVSIQSKSITILVQNGALAGALRMHLHELQDLCATDKRLVLRIG